MGGGQVLFGLLGKPENTQDFNWGWGKFSFPKKWCFSCIWVVSRYDDPSLREKTTRSMVGGVAWRFSHLTDAWELCKKPNDVGTSC